jgi:hypothetical protein
VGEEGESRKDGDDAGVGGGEGGGGFHVYNKLTNLAQFRTNQPDIAEVRSQCKSVVIQMRVGFIVVFNNKLGALLQMQAVQFCKFKQCVFGHVVRDYEAMEVMCAGCGQVQHFCWLHCRVSGCLKCNQEMQRLDLDNE